MIGFEVQTVKVEFLKPGTQKINFKLKPKVLQAPEITIEMSKIWEWEKNLEKFHIEFFGRTKNASKCKVLNPDVLEFKIDKQKKLFSVTANQPLEIINQALGYRIHAILKTFWVHKSGNYKYVVKVKFTELEPKNEKEQKKWQKNRLKAYSGSFRHFLIALAKNRLVEEGFNISGMRLEDTQSNHYELKSAQIISPYNDYSGQQSDCMLLHFPDWLRVEYGKYRDVSFINLNQNEIKIHKSGYVYEQDKITLYNYWSHQRFAEELPINYKAP